MAFPRGLFTLARVRDAMISLAVTAGIFVAVEAGLRLFASQETTIEFKNGKSIAVEDGVLGHVYRPNSAARTRTPEFDVEFEINQDGMRDESRHPDPKPAGTTRILLLGDSFTFGDANAYDEIWPVVFERALLEKGYDVDVIKAGVSGYDTRTELLYLKRLYSSYDPDVVILGFLPNDLMTNTPMPDDNEPAESPRGEVPVRVVRARNEKSTRLHVVTFAKRLLLPSDYLYVKLYLLTARAEYFTVPMTPRVERQMEITRGLLRELNDYCRERQTKFVVFSIPQLFQVLMEANEYKRENVSAGFIDSTLAGFAAENGFLWLPVLPRLAEAYRIGGEDIYYRFDGHFNNRGNEIAGEYLAEQFLELYGGEAAKRIE